MKVPKIVGWFACLAKKQLLYKPLETHPYLLSHQTFPWPFWDRPSPSEPPLEVRFFDHAPWPSWWNKRLDRLNDGLSPMMVNIGFFVVFFVRVCGFFLELLWSDFHRLDFWGCVFFFHGPGSESGESGKESHQSEFFDVDCLGRGWNKCRSAGTIDT